jgi:hypothetical protein
MGSTQSKAMGFLLQGWARSGCLMPRAAGIAHPDLPTIERVPYEERLPKECASARRHHRQRRWNGVLDDCRPGADTSGNAHPALTPM